MSKKIDYQTNKAKYHLDYLKKLGFSQNDFADLLKPYLPLPQNRICKHCGEVYTYKHHKQQYCKDRCRMLAWEKRTGKTLTIPKGEQSEVEVE